jgi:hypothetical protein
MALLPQLGQRLMGTVPLAKAVGKRLEVWLEDRLPEHHHRPLDNLVLEAGFAYRPLLAIILLTPDPLDGRRHIPIVAQPLVQVPEILLQVFGILLRLYLVHPRRTVLPGAAIGFPQEVTVNQVKHVVEPHLRIALCLLCKVLVFRGYGW